MQSCSARLRLSRKFAVIVCVAFLSALTVGTVACAHHAAPLPTQAQAPSAAPAQIATEKAAPAPRRADCGGKNQPPCEPPPCGDLNDDCCQPHNTCHAGLVCKNGSCVQAGPPCGGLDQACCVNRIPVCNNDLLKCTTGKCTSGTMVNNLTVTLRTNDEDKDPDTGVRIAIDGLTTWSQPEDLGYPDWSTHIWSLNPPVVRLDDLAGRYVSICMQPHGPLGDDTWKFNFLLQGNRSDGLTYEIRKDNVFLSTDVPCLSWDATPAPTPNGQIVSGGGKCLTATKGGVMGSLVQLKNCVSGADQDWILAPKASAPLPDGARTGQIRHLTTECLGLRGGSTASGTLVELQGCDGSPEQQWKWFGDPTPKQDHPTQVTGPLARCLDPNAAGEVSVSMGAPTSGVGVIGDTSLRFLQYVDCDGSASQSWKLPACGVEGKACCGSGMPCQGNLSCKKATCTADPPNVNFLSATLDTTNEDKNADTQVSVEGLFFWPGDDNTPYDDWSTHLATLSPSSIPLAELPFHELFLRANPNGDDSWKLNFIINGVRDDGTHFEFRKDNIWLTNEGAPATEIHWHLEPPGLDLVWRDFDANGLPLNPTWRGSPGGKSCLEDTRASCWDAFKVCPYHPSPLESNNWCLPFSDKCTGATPDDYGRCSSQSPTYDRSWLCGWHANWFPVTLDGTASSADFSTFPGDGDWHVKFRPHDLESNVGRDMLLAEFDSDETTENFSAGFWKDEVDLSEVVHENQARIIGLMGLDTEHAPPGGHGELHPTYAFEMRLNGSSTALDTWAIFVRNWGNEGACGGSQHLLDLTQFTLRFPAPPEAEQATSVQERPQTIFEAGIENDSNFSGFTRSRPSPVQHDAIGPYVEMTFNIGPPKDHTFIDGSLVLTWMCGPSICTQIHSPQTPAARAPATSATKDVDSYPGANLLTKSQVGQLRKQFPSRRLGTRAPAREVAIVPFTKSTPQLFQVGQGSLTDRTVPDPARQERMVEVQKSICRMLGNDPKRPAICNSLH